MIAALLVLALAPLHAFTAPRAVRAATQLFAAPPIDGLADRLLAAKVASGKTFDDNAAHRLYACSRPTGQLDLFVSHSWRASSSGKWLALNVRMNGSTAAVASVVVAGALAAARRQGLLPAGGGYRDEQIRQVQTNRR